MKTFIEKSVKVIFKYFAIAWVLLMVFDEYYRHQFGFSSDLALKMATFGGTLISYYLWFYLIPKTSWRVICLFHEMGKDKTQMKKLAFLIGAVLIKVSLFHA